MRMKRREFMGSLAAMALAGPLMAMDSPNNRPNFILLFTDDQSYHLGMLGVQGLKTPHIDALADEGVFFTKAYSAAASCSPSRSAILTGMHSHANGHWRNTEGPVLADPDIQFSRQSQKVDKVGVHEDLPTLPEILNANGYATGITDKFHLSPPWKFPFQYRYPLGLTPAEHGRVTARFFSETQDKPFFLMANIRNTHRPFRQHIDAAGLPEIDPEDVEIPPNWPDTPLMRKDYAEYLTTVEHADAIVGAILESLKESGRAENTIVIFTSDQGFCYHRAKATAYDWGVHVPFSITGPGIQKSVMTDELASHTDVVPTILDYAGIPIPQTVQGKSLRPFLEGRADTTGYDYVVSEHNAHGPGPEEYYPTRSITDGRYRYIRNLRPEVTPDYPIERFVTDPEFAEKPKALAWMPWDATPSSIWENRAFAEIIKNKEAFPKQYELLYETFYRPGEELYDLHTDPYEMDNLIEKPELKETVERMSRALDTWMKETGDIGDPRSVPRREKSNS